jgi:hypothetical protein
VVVRSHFVLGMFLIAVSLSGALALHNYTRHDHSYKCRPGGGAGDPSALCYSERRSPWADPAAIAIAVSGILSGLALILSTRSATGREAPRPTSRSTV